MYWPSIKLNQKNCPFLTKMFLVLVFVLLVLLLVLLAIIFYFDNLHYILLLHDEIHSKNRDCHDKAKVLTKMIRTFLHKSSSAKIYT